MSLAASLKILVPATNEHQRRLGVQYRRERIWEIDTADCNKHWHSVYTDVYGNKYVKDSMKCKMRIKRLLYFELTGS